MKVWRWCLSLEPFLDARIHEHKRRRHDLDRHPAIQADVVCQEDDRHPAASEFAEDLVLAARSIPERVQ